MLILAALLVAFLWGATPIIHKHVLKYVSPAVILVVGGTAYYITLLAYAAYNWKKLYPEIQTLTAINTFWICLASLIMSFVAKILYLHVLKKKESYVVSALVFSAPFFTAILAVLLLKEKVTLEKLVGVMLIVIGIVVLSRDGVSVSAQ